MSDFLARMKSAAKADKKTIVLPEGEDPRTIEAAKKIVEEGLANLVILGDPEQIKIDGVTVIDPRTAEKKQAYAEKFAELRAKKGVTLPEALEQMNDATYFGTMMVKMGDADGLVSGACHSTANTLRPAQGSRNRPGHFGTMPRPYNRRAIRRDDTGPGLRLVGHDPEDDAVGLVHAVAADLC